MDHPTANIDDERPRGGTRAVVNWWIRTAKRLQVEPGQPLGDPNAKPSPEMEHFFGRVHLPKVRSSCPCRATPSPPKRSRPGSAGPIAAFRRKGAWVVDECDSPARPNATARRVLNRIRLAGETSVFRLTSDRAPKGGVTTRFLPLAPGSVGLGHLQMLLDDR
jgi:hypothetical protein